MFDVWLRCVRVVLEWALLPARQPEREPSLETERSVELLRSWLTPEQLRQFDEFKSFEVVGCHTGTVYTLDTRVAYNIQRSKGQRLCFMPQGFLPTGDVILAQKIALETDENAALQIANVADSDN